MRKRPGKITEVFSQRRCAWFTMRLMPSEKQAIRKASASVGQTMTGYLLGLHGYAVGASKTDA